MKELKFTKKELFYINLDSIEKICLAMDCKIEDVVGIKKIIKVRKYERANKFGITKKEFFKT